MMTELKRAGGNEPRDFKELSLEELRRGYVIHRDGTYTCIFCGASFETGVIYHSRGRDVTAERAIREHMQEVHSGTFWPMLELDKTLNGLTEVQKTLLSCIYEGKSTDEIGEIMGISTRPQIQPTESQKGGQDPAGSVGDSGRRGAACSPPGARRERSGVFRDRTDRRPVFTQYAAPIFYTVPV